MEFLRTYQLELMLILTGICGLILFFSVTIKNLSSRSRFAFIMLNASAMLLILADRYAYIFRGDESSLGFWMVRITNFTTFTCTIGLMFFYNSILESLLAELGDVKKKILRLKLNKIFCAIAELLIIVSQFTGLYYTFDATNHYQRSSLNWISYVLPLTVMIIQLSVILNYRKKFSKRILVMLILFDTLPIVTSVVQMFIYGLSLTNISSVIVVIILYFIALGDMNRWAEKGESLEMEHIREQQARTQRLFDQTAISMIDALDSKEEYTQGHSVRVAKYAKQLAELAGKDEKEQNEIYYAGLLHDIGKIGVPDEIINKKGELTPEEYEIMKQHPVIGRHILSGITEMPYLGIGASFHHERYDGTGYPEGLKGEEIPELGRILAVADAYDAMSSMRSYRDAIPQQKIREEFIKHSGTQFDPEYAKLMQHLIDLDSEYQMKEKTDTSGESEKTSLECRVFGDDISEGILINSNPTTIRLTCSPLNYADTDDEAVHMPSLILFDSLDAKVYTEEPFVSELNYFEYATVRFDGEINLSGARDHQTDVSHNHSVTVVNQAQDVQYVIEAMRYKDHAMITINNELRSVKVILALPDKTRFMYAAISGENCRISDITVQKSEDEISQYMIPRIAEEISYIAGPCGMIPNVQIDGYRTDATEGIPIRDSMDISFHTMSLPTARLVWHTAFIDIYSSDNRRVDGSNRKEYALIRLDGEYWEDSDGLAENDMSVTKTADFVDWDVWKELNKNGMDVHVHLERDGNRVTTITENAGISIRNVTTINAEVRNLLVTLTGDQVAITNVQIS